MGNGIQIIKARELWAEFEDIPMNPKTDGLTLRRTTKEDWTVARTDYQREADYVISNGACEWFSKNGSLRDMMLFVREWKAAGI